MSKGLCKKLLKESQSKIPIFLEKFSQCIINEEASIFCGTGVSMNSGLPSWRILLEPCIEELNLSGEKNLDLYKVAQYYANAHNDALLRKMINEKINCFYDTNPIIQALLSINFKSI